MTVYFSVFYIIHHKTEKINTFEKKKTILSIILCITEKTVSLFGIPHRKTLNQTKSDVSAQSVPA